MSNPVNAKRGICPLCQQPLLVTAKKETMEEGVKRYSSSLPPSALSHQLLYDLRHFQTQLTTQPLGSLRRRDAIGSLMRLSAALIWSGHLVCIPMGNIPSGSSVKGKRTSFLRALLGLVGDTVTGDLSRCLLRLVVYSLGVCLGRYVRKSREGV